MEHQSSSFLEVLYDFISCERGQPVFAGSVGFGVEVCSGFFFVIVFVLFCWFFLIVALRKSIITMRVQQTSAK